jgi:hypothetical protein
MSSLLHSGMADDGVAISILFKEAERSSTQIRGR